MGGRWRIHSLWPGQELGSKNFLKKVRGDSRGTKKCDSGDEIHGALVRRLLFEVVFQP
jgi:hypothetical protein